MEVGYVQSLDFLIQLKTRSGNFRHEIIEAGSEKDAKHKMQQLHSDEDYSAGIVVTNIKANGEPGELGDGQLPGAEKDIEEVIDQVREDE